MTFSNPVSGEGRGDAGIESAGRAAASLPVGVVRSLASVAVGLGVLLRLLLLHQRAPLWQDEAMVAVNVLHRSWSDLLRPLDYAQVAPLPYLLCLKVMVALFGHGEAVLRLPAFVAGICMLVVLYEVAKDRLGLQVTLAALVLAGCSAILLRYSAEVKPYSFDALFGAAVPYVVIRIEGRACRNPRRLLGLWVAGMAAGSIVAPFLVGGLLIAIAASPVARARIGWPILGAVAFGAATVYAVLYFGVYGPTVTSAPMLQFWGSGFLDLLEPGRFERLRRLLSGFAQLLPSFPPLAGEMRTLLIVAAGVLLLPGSAGLGLALTAPSLLAIIASALGLYPISPRLLLISYTPLLLGLAATFSALSPASKSQRARAHVVLLVLSVAVLPGVSALPPDWSVLGVLVAALLVVSLGTHFPPAVRLILPAALAILVVLPKAAVVIHTPARNDGRITIARVVAAPGSAVYIPAAAAPAWLYYTSRWDGSDARRLDWYLAQARPTGPAMPLDMPRAISDETSPPSFRPDPAWRSGDRLEILGAWPGVVYHYPLGYLIGPLPVWAAAEAEVINATVGDRLVIVETRQRVSATDSLLRLLATQGWVLDSVWREYTASATYLHRAP